MTLDEPGSSRSAWTVVALLFGFMLINFADKVVLALAAVPVMDEFSLTPTRFGLLGSSFFFLFAITGVITGFIVNKVQARWVILAMALGWSLAQFSVMAATGFALLMGSRIILGAGEGPAYPVAIHAVYKWFGNEQRSIPTAVVVSGAIGGVVVAPPALTAVITHLSWRWAFGVLGVLGLIWALAWLALGAEGNRSGEPQHEGASTPYARLLLNGTTLATFACGFGGYWGAALIFTWFTPYLVKGLGFSLSAAGWLTAVPALATIAVMGAGACLSQAALSHGATTRVARGILAGVAALVGGLVMVWTPHVASPAAKVIVISLGVGLPAMIGVTGLPIIGEFTPVQQRGAMLAITNSIWTTAGVIAPYVMGRVIEGGATAAQGYEHGFVVCGVISSVGGILGLIFLRPETELKKLGRFAEEPLPREGVAPEIARGG
jgi:MFS transporter, ACS family, D-galactonate transporter